MNTRINVDVSEVLAFVRRSPGVTTPDMAERFGLSVSIARWVVHQIPALEFYDGNHIRLRQEVNR